MATILDVGLLQSFDFIFPVLLVFAIVFAVLQKTKVIGDSIGINSIIAITAAFMVLLSEDLVKMINFMVPWFVFAIIFFILLILIFQMFGAKEADITAVLKADSAISWTIIGIALVIVFAAFGNVLGQKFTEASFQQGTATMGVVNGSINATVGTGVSSANFQQNIYSILFNTKVLGLMVLFGVAIFAVALLTGSSK